LPDDVRGKLDYSPESLDVIELWLLQRYPSLERRWHPVTTRSSTAWRATSVRRCDAVL
jgi:hypothetical protein